MQDAPTCAISPVSVWCRMYNLARRRNSPVGELRFGDLELNTTSWRTSSVSLLELASILWAMRPSHATRAVNCWTIESTGCASSPDHGRAAANRSTSSTIDS